MKLLPIIIISLFTLSCNSSVQNTNEDKDHLSVFEINILDSDKQIVELNVGYTILFKKKENKNCELNTLKEVNDVLIVTTIRSFLREEIGEIPKTEIKLLDNDILKDKINKRLHTEGGSLNGKSLNCKAALGLFNITER